jgi:hypothetical protein
MPGKGGNSGTVNGADTGIAGEAFEELHGEQPESSALNRNELMQLTGKELAKMAAPYSELRLNTLERKPKAELCDIIMQQGQPQEKDEKPNARAARTESQTEQFINGVLNVLDVLKQNRDGEQLHPVAKQIFQKQAIAYTDEKIQSGDVDINKTSNLMLYGVTAYLLFDGLVGVKNSPTLFRRARNFFQKRKEK